MIGLRPGHCSKPSPAACPHTRSPAATPVSRMVHCSSTATVRGAVTVKSPSAFGAQRSTGRACADARRHWSLVFLVMPAFSPEVSASKS